ncbi:unnamed protein product [Symbiodinium natans]|uniref:Broad-range acid phosphatase DET1 n=1 Tax=Symbiodinium natans TaxID=878477 RepID=A0A812S9R4_9DINO|nr:unnamed protein product [Symbiodinium natans]
MAEQSDNLTELLARLARGEMDEAVKAIQARNRDLLWHQLPERIVLLRHGQSEGNVDHLLYTSKGDSRLELTKRGIRQAREAGKRLKELSPKHGKVIICTSPFERTTQTLLALYAGGFNQENVECVHVDPQIREQEFGNFQDPGLTSKVRAEEQRVGRFYYRRPNAESSADVFDRVTQFWDKLFEDNGKGLLTDPSVKYDMCLMVTHGLTIRLMLMCLFKWSVETFASVWNLGNCEHITLKKNAAEHKYEICIEESYPQRLPWATREAWIVFNTKNAPEEMLERLGALQEARDALCDEGVREEALRIDKALDSLENKILRVRSEPYTVIDYLAIPQPRTTQKEEVLSRLVPGHGHGHKSPEEMHRLVSAPDEDDIEFIDWWGDNLSYQGKMLRLNRVSTIHSTRSMRSTSPSRNPSQCQAGGGESSAEADDPNDL